MTTRIQDGLLTNLCLNTDSYKASHFLQYPAAACGSYAYVEARGGADQVLFFGLQMILKEYLSRPVSAEDVAIARDIFTAHGEPFNEAGFSDLVNRLGGRLPVEIMALPEGTWVPVRTPLLTVEATDPAFFWLPSYLETLLLQVWYPTTVATLSGRIRKLISACLEKTADNLDGLPFKLHDFGFRGASSVESAARGGCAHLVNFSGTDTVAALLAARGYYGAAMPGFSIPAAEHSTITSWGRAGEADAYRNMLRQFGRPGAIFAVVSDSYDLDHAVLKLWGEELRQSVIESGATLVVRPDSGDPATIVLRTAQNLDAKFGATLNSKGYRVLKHVRIIQGDGINEKSIAEILEKLTAAGYSADNLAFGMGGALLQGGTRDTYGFAMKTSAVRVGNDWIDVCKDPITDPGKRSKAGRVTAAVDAEGKLVAARRSGWADSMPTVGNAYREAMVPVYRNGELLIDWTFDEIRARAAG